MQETILRARTDVAAFVLLTERGTAEYRSPYPLTQLRVMLQDAINAL